MVWGWGDDNEVLHGIFKVRNMLLASGHQLFNTLFKAVFILQVVTLAHVLCLAAQGSKLDP